MAINLNKDGDESSKKDSGSGTPKPSINLGKSDPSAKKPIDLKKPPVESSPSASSQQPGVQPTLDKGFQGSSSVSTNEKNGTGIYKLLGILVFGLLGAGIWYFTSKKDTADLPASGTVPEVSAKAPGSPETNAGPDTANVASDVTSPATTTTSENNVSPQTSTGNNVPNNPAQQGNDNSNSIKQPEQSQISSGGTITDTKSMPTVVSGQQIKAFFAPGSSSGPKIGREDIAAILAYLKKNPNGKIRVEGYASSEGNPAINQQLSVQRAEQMKRNLLARGVPSSSIDAQGMGIENPIADNATPEGRKMNRRVQILLQ